MMRLSKRGAFKYIAAPWTAILNPKIFATAAEGETNKASLLSEVAQILASSANSVKYLGDRFAALILEDKNSSAQSLAEKERERLKSIYVNLTVISKASNRMILRSFKQYLGMYNIRCRHRADAADLANCTSNLSTDWYRLTKVCADALGSIEALLRDIREERSDFVLEPAYQEIFLSLSSRASILGDLRAAAPPHTPSEISALEEVATQYEYLVKQLEYANTQLADYLRDVRSIQTYDFDKN